MMSLRTASRLRHVGAELLGDQSGQGLVEYALIIALISLAALGVMTQLGKHVNNSLGKAIASLS